MTDSPEARIEARLKRNFPIYDYVGLEIESASDGIYRCVVPLRESNVNHIATVHAAIQWAAAEVLGGMVVMSVFCSEPGLVRAAPKYQLWTIDCQRSITAWLMRL